MIDEGFAREMGNKIQNMRKTSGLEVTDRIHVRVGSTERLRTAANRHKDFICRETLASTLEFVESDRLDGSTQWDINGETTHIAVAKI